LKFFLFTGILIRDTILKNVLFKGQMVLNTE
jgi:hypothetical protein